MKLADDKDAILWMLRNVDGSPVILEGTTPGYRWGSRYSIYTGLPAVQGWDWHQKQQRSVVPGVEIDRRLANVREIYDTGDLARAQKLLDYYGVSYIVVGPLEQAYYNSKGLAKFEKMVEQGYLAAGICQQVGEDLRGCRARCAGRAADERTGIRRRPTSGADAHTASRRAVRVAADLMQWRVTIRPIIARMATPQMTRMRQSGIWFRH